MSWQAYVDTNLVGTGNVSQAAIYGLNGGEWAKSAGFQVSFFFFFFFFSHLEMKLLKSQYS
jgi:hypothetical protein